MSLFENTLRQIRRAAVLMDLNKDIETLLSNPQRVLTVNIPVRMDDGQLRVYKGYRVEHNNICGPYKGGIRYHEQVDLEEVKALSAWMTIKTSVIGLPLGGGKGGIEVNPKELSETELERLTRRYVQLIEPIIGPKRDVPAPDVNTTPQIMAWIADEYSKIVGEDSPGVVTGKPLEVGGIKGRSTATAQGGVYILDELAAERNMNPEETTVIVQGFGNAGSFAASILAAKGYKIVGVSDSRGGIFCSHGIDPDGLMNCKREKGTVNECAIDASKLHGQDGASCKKVTNKELLEQECDILILAALENQITDKNATHINAKVILELANGPVAPSADEILAGRDITVIPDILANAGGVTVSYFEMLQNASGELWTEDKVQEELKEKMVIAWKEVKLNADKYDCTMREAAFITAIGRLEKKIMDKGDF